MIGVIRRDAAQFREQLRGDALRFGVLHAVDHPVTHGLDGGKERLRFEPVQKETRGRMRWSAAASDADRGGFPGDR